MKYSTSNIVPNFALFLVYAVDISLKVFNQ